MNIQQKKLILSAILLPVSILPAWAQDISDRPKEMQLDEVVVTGTGTEHYLKDAPVQTEVITAKALEQYQARTMEELLSGLCPALTTNENDMGAQLKLNGLNNDYILILINGKRMNGDVGGQKDFNRINIADIDRVEIVRGAASSLYGSDAIAGVINIITKRPKDPVNFSNSTRVGAYGEIRQSNSFGFRIGKLTSTTTANFRHTDGWRNTEMGWDHGDLVNGWRSKTVNRSTNYTIGQHFTWHANEKLELTAEGSYYERWVMRPIDQNYNFHKYNFYYRNYTLAAGAKWKLRGANYLQADVDYGRFGYFYDYKSRAFTDYFDENGNGIYYLDGDRIKQKVQRQLTAQVKGVFYFGNNHIFHTGAEYLLETLESPHHLTDMTSASAYTLSAYAQDEWNLTSRFLVTAGLRGTWHKEFDMHFSPKVALKYTLGPVNLRGTWSLGFKAPTTQELYYNYIGTMMSGTLKSYYGNRDLKPQTSVYYSAGAEYNRGKLRASLTGAYNTIHDMIELVEIPVPPADKLQEVRESRQYQNLTKARVWSLDASFSYSGIRNITLGGGYSYADAQAIYAADKHDKRYMQYVPIDGTSRHSATLNATWTHRWGGYRLGIGLYGKFQSGRLYLSENDTEDFQTWRINTSHSLLNLRHWQLTGHLGIDNIFNYADRTPFGRNRGTTTPGRTVYCSLTATLGKNSKSRQSSHSNQEP